MSAGKSKGSKTGSKTVKNTESLPKTDENLVFSSASTHLACIVATPEGIDLLVKAQPGAKKTGVLGLVGDAIRLGVSAPPEDGKANEALVELVAAIFGVRKSVVSLVSGKSARAKRFRIVGLFAGEAHTRIKPHLSE